MDGAGEEALKIRQRRAESAGPIGIARGGQLRLERELKPSRSLAAVERDADASEGR